MRLRVWPDFLKIMSIIYAFNVMIIAECALMLVVVVNVNYNITISIINAFKVVLKGTFKI